jgi:hypothetical protein
MTKYHPLIALTFFIFGALVSYGFYLLIDFGNSMAGAGDGASSGSIVPASHVMVPYACYFVSGIIACLMPPRALRYLLAVIGHISPFIVFLMIKDINIRIVEFFSIINAFIFIPFGFAWYKLLRDPKDAISLQ